MSTRPLPTQKQWDRLERYICGFGCPPCKGTGIESGKSTGPCRWCGGKRKARAWLDNVLKMDVEP